MINKVIMIYKSKLKKILAIAGSFAVLFIFCAAAFAETTKTDLGDFIPCEGPECGVCDVFKLISNVVRFAAFKLASPLAAVILVYGGFKLITSGGNASEKEKGMNAIWAAVWGIVITFGAWVIVNAIIGGLAGNSISQSWYRFPGCV